VHVITLIVNERACLAESLAHLPVCTVIRYPLTKEPRHVHAITTDIRPLLDERVGLVTTGQIMPAFERFYAEDVVMQENTKEPTVGKTANRAREEGFVAYVKEVHENRAAAVATDGNTAFIAWVLDFTAADGSRHRSEQVTHQVWENGLIVRERFYYDSASVELCAVHDT
jgi:ketosteroid isomerase-like protein